MLKNNRKEYFEKQLRNAADLHSFMYSWLSKETKERKKVLTYKNYFEEEKVNIEEDCLKEEYYGDFSFACIFNDDFNEKQNCDFCPFKWDSDNKCEKYLEKIEQNKNDYNAISEIYKEISELQPKVFVNSEVVE